MKLNYIYSYGQTCSKDHLYMKKICFIKTLGWSLYTSFTVDVLGEFPHAQGDSQRNDFRA